jgi:hypothetical protein
MYKNHLKDLKEIQHGRTAFSVVRCNEFLFWLVRLKTFSDTKE